MHLNNSIEDEKQYMAKFAFQERRLYVIIFHMQHLSVPASGPSQRICAADESLLCHCSSTLCYLSNNKKQRITSLHLSYIKYGFVVVVGVSF